MEENRFGIFDVVLLAVGIGAAVLGFKMINQAYRTESGPTGWLMIISIFSWLSLLVMFILLSVMVDVSKKELMEIKTLIRVLSENKKKK